jgi:hypothetical protein
LGLSAAYQLAAFVGALRYYLFCPNRIKKGYPLQPTALEHLYFNWAMKLRQQQIWKAIKIKK